jgi:hypothetical protein
MTCSSSLTLGGSVCSRRIDAIWWAGSCVLGAIPNSASAALPLFSTTYCALSTQDRQRWSVKSCSASARKPSASAIRNATSLDVLTVALPGHGPFFGGQGGEHPHPCSSKAAAHQPSRLQGRHDLTLQVLEICLPIEANPSAQTSTSSGVSSPCNSWGVFAMSEILSGRRSSTGSSGAITVRCRANGSCGRSSMITKMSWSLSACDSARLREPKRTTNFRRAPKCALSVLTKTS